MRSIDPESPRTLPPSRPWPRSATPSAIGMWHDLVALGEHGVGQPSRSAPTTSVTSRVLQLGQRPALARRPAPPAARAARRPRARARPGRRRSRPSTPARPCARTDRRCPGRARRCRAPNASAERSTVPTLPGSPTPHSATHSGPAGSAPSAAGRRPSARVPDPSWEIAASSGGATSSPSRPEPGGHEPHRRRPARGLGGRDQVLTLGDELAQLVAPLAARELADLGEVVVVGAGDQGRKKKGAAPTGGAPGALVSSAVRPTTPRGRSRQSVGRSRHRARRCRRASCGRARCRPASGRA